QLTFPVMTLVQAIQLPTNTKRPRCATIRPNYLSDLQYIADAARDAIDVYFGKTVEEGIFFASKNDETDWLGRIMGMTDDSGEKADGETNRQPGLPGTENLADASTEQVNE